MNGVRTKKTPSRMIRTPATCSSVARWSFSVLPIPVAVIPSATNTTVNDRQKTAPGSSTRSAWRWPLWNSAI